MSVVGRDDISGQLPAILGKCVDRVVWVIGDVMLDEYVHGHVERISPEAPVPVVHAADVQFRLGGAANVAKQVVALGSRAVLGGVIGDDDAASWVAAACMDARIDVSGLVRDPRRRTTRKMRVLGHGQQLVRIDWEERHACDPEALTQMHAQMMKTSAPEIIVLSDYAKGVLSEACVNAFVQTGRTKGCRVLVDPKRTDLRSYRGASILTPNLHELSQAVGRQLTAEKLSEVDDAARSVVDDAKFDGILVTLGDQGMRYLGADGSTHHIYATRRAVADVTGAGDTVVAVLSAALAAGSSVRNAMEIASVAAGLAVSEIGAVAVSASQIAEALSLNRTGKVLGRIELSVRAATWRAQGKRIVFTNGCFDLLHAGHVSLLRKAAALGDVLVLAINSDDSVRRLKGPNRPIVTSSDRAELLAALSCVSAVSVFDEDTPLELLRAVRPHVLVKGQDYELTDVVGREIIEADGGRVELVPLLDARSTTAIIERIRHGPAGT
jgi:D-beta-D-heptose 7-phosphate kinase/D-beta-D-heptose 1-phosphate adenosyltransferase